MLRSHLGNYCVAGHTQQADHGKKASGMNYKCFEVSKADGVAHVKMCRPQKANSMNEDFWRELPQILKEFDQAGDVRVCILSGSGKNFSGGMDLSFFAKPEFATFDNARKREVMIGVAANLQGVFNRIEKVRFPVIAAVQGACIGGALDMIAACDLRYASKCAQFSIEEINIGMMADLGSLQRLPLLMPEGLVREMAYTGQKIDAKRALESGLLNQVFRDHEEMMHAVFEIAKTIAFKSPLAIAASKKSFNYSRNNGLRDSLEYVGLLQAASLEPADIGVAMKGKSGKTDSTFKDLSPLLMAQDSDE
ncbi:MAG: enoyl-CoA hydratase-related protein [Devosiaceae bacterium]|nr:enoyl-CoA hydratase-related protein [Devosiaceae bacterium]